MFAQGFAIKKELIDGKSVKEEGVMAKFNEDGVRIVEVNDGNATYTELSHQDIKNLISVRSNTSDLMERLIPLLKRKKHRRRHTKHHVRHHARRHTKHHTRRHQPHGVASGHTKKHKKRQHTRKRKRKRKRTKHRKRR